MEIDVGPIQMSNLAQPFNSEADQTLEQTPLGHGNSSSSLSQDCIPCF